MVGAARIVLIAMALVAIAACQTDGVIGPESDTGGAKPRVIDTPKTLTRTAAAKPKPRAPEASTAQGDGGAQVAALRSEREDSPRADTATAKPRSPDMAAIPAQSLFGNWTLALGDGKRRCSMILGGVQLGTAYSARGGADCPDIFAAVQTWEIQGDELILRNPSRGIVGRLQPTGPSRFDGHAQDGAAFYLLR